MAPNGTRAGYAMAGFQFEAFCDRLLERRGYHVEYASLRPGAKPLLGGEAPDLIVSEPTSGTRILVEIKLYSTRRPGSRLLPEVVSSITRTREALGIESAILIVLNRLAPEHYSRLQDDASITVWDLDTLLEYTAQHLDLTRELAEILENLPITEPDWLSEPLQVLRARLPKSSVAIDPRALIAELRSCPAGRPGAHEFERLCVTAFTYLFEADFRSWNPQNRVEAGFHRIDLIARLVPKHDFWLSVAHDFRTRYVVFEFKNYVEPITQNEIYTTEKYLFLTAMRSVAVIVARNGVSDGARHACKGALREHGKLILCLTLEELIGMIEQRRIGDDPCSFLFEVVDAMLMDIGR